MLLRLLYGTFIVLFLTIASTFFSPVDHFNFVDRSVASAPESCLDLGQEFLSKTESGKSLNNVSKQLNNKPITIPLSASTAAKKFFGKTYDALHALFEIDKTPTVLMAATEWGTISLDGHDVTAKVGGLAMVLNDMIKNLPDFFKSIGRKAKVSFVFMEYDGVPQGKFVDSISISMGESVQKVDVYTFTLSNGVDVYFLSHPLFKRRSIVNKQKNLYSPQEVPAHELFSGRAEWEEAYLFGLYNKGIAEMQKRLKANIYHAHDYHTALAGLHMSDDVVLSLSIHNAGPGYQGLYWTRGYGWSQGGKYFNHELQTMVPPGDASSQKKLLSYLGVDYQTYIHYFEQSNGDFNTLKGMLKIIEEKNLVAGSPVSDGYQRELDYSFDEFLSEVKKQKGQEPKNIDKVFIPNGKLDMGLLDGITNGMDDGVHASKNKFLEKKSDEEIEALAALIVDPEVRQLWKNDLRFGRELESEAGQKVVREKKRILKNGLQKLAGIEQNSEKPLFTIVSRIVDQKNLPPFIENIRKIVRSGGQVVIGGQPGDESGQAVAKTLAELESDPELKGQIKYFNQFVAKELATLIQVGGDFTVITSKFEPCGLTDIESAFLGTIPLVRKTGGLGKVKNGFVYEWLDNSDHQGEVAALEKALDHVISLYKNDRAQIEKMRIGGMKEDFSWRIALAHYYENYRTAALYKFVKKTEERIRKGELNGPESTKAFKELFKEEKFSSLMENFYRVLNRKKNKTLFEHDLLQ